MPAKIYRNGLGATSGDPLVVNGQTYILGLSIVVYVHHTGSDANNTGLERELPMATIAAAYTDWVALGRLPIIVCLDGHTESITSTLTIAADGVTIVGEGSSGGLPTVKITGAVPLGIGINVAADNFEIRNVWLFGDAAASSGEVVSWQATREGGRVVGCLLDQTTVSTLGTSATCDDFMMDGCTVRNATAVAAASVTANGEEGMRVYDTVLESGSGGFGGSAGAPYALFLANANVSVRMEDITQRDGDIGISVGSTGYVQVPIASGSGRVDCDLAVPS